MNPKNWVADRSGSAGFLQAHSEETTTLGGESGRRARFASYRKYELAGVDGDVVLGGKKNGVKLHGSGSLLGLEIKTNTDHISSTIPKASGSAQLNTIKFDGDASLRLRGKDHKVLSGSLSGPGVSVSASAGGKQIVPTGSAKAYVGSAKGELGYDDHKVVSFSTSLGPSASTEFDALKFNPFAPNQYAPLKSSAEASLPGDSYNASVPGVVKSGFKKESSYKPEVGTDLSTDNLASRADDADALAKHNLIAEAKGQHKQNDNVFTKHPSLFAKRNYDRSADKSGALVNRLTEQIDNDKLQKQAIDQQLKNPDLSKNERKSLEDKRDKLDKNINDMSDCRKQMISDRDRANDYRNRDNNRDFNRNGPQRTDDLVKGAKAYSQNLDSNLSSMRDEKGKLPKDYADKLSTDARGVHRAQADLNHRSNQYDRQLNAYNDKIDQIGKERAAYLEQKGMTPQEAIASKDKKYADYNNYEKNLRDKTADIRQKQGECKKALMETDKVRGTGESEELRAKGRQLESDKIDNENAKAAKDDEIANYCNSHGIPQDKYDDYLKNNDDRDLQKLVDERKELEGQGNDIQRDLDINKKDVALGDNSGISVTDDKGLPAIKKVDDAAVARAKDNEDIRNGKAAEKEAAKLKENNDDKTTPPPPPPPGGDGAGSDGGSGANDGSTESQGTSQMNDQLASESAVAANESAAEKADTQANAPTGADSTRDLEQVDSDIDPSENGSDLAAQSDETLANVAPAEGESQDAVNEVPSEGEDNAAEQNNGLPAENAAEESEHKEESPAEDEGKDASSEDESKTDGEGEDTSPEEKSQAEDKGEETDPEEKSQNEDQGKDTAPDEESQSELESEDNAPEESASEEAPQTEDQGEETAPTEESQTEGEGEESAPEEESQGEGEGEEAVPEEEYQTEGEGEETATEEESQAEDQGEEAAPEEEYQTEGEGEETAPEEESQTEDQDEEAAPEEESQTEGEGKETAPEEESQTEDQDEEAAPEEESQAEGEGEETAPEEESQTEEEGEETAPEEESQAEEEGEETAPEEETQTGDDGGDDTQEEDPKYEEENQEEVPEKTQSEGTENMPAEEAPVVNGEEAAPEEQSQAEGEDIAPEEESQSEGEDEENAPEEESQGEGESEEDAPQESQSDGEAEGTEEAEAEGQDQEPEEQSDEEGMDSDGQDNGSEITAADANEISGAPEETSDGMSTTSADEVSSEPQEEADGMSTTGYAEGTGESLGSSDGMSVTNESDVPDESMSSSEGMSTTADGQTESAPEVSSGESMDSGQSM